MEDILLEGAAPSAGLSLTACVSSFFFLCVVIFFFFPYWDLHGVLLLLIFSACVLVFLSLLSKWRPTAKRDVTFFLPSFSITCHSPFFLSVVFGDRKEIVALLLFLVGKDL